jgi:hypothetical protein
MTNNIPFIHSFCDRWCEHCRFTSRCGVYALEKTLLEEEKDMDNPAFFSKIMENMLDLKESIIEDGKKFGIDIEGLTDEDMQEVSREMERVDALTEADDLIILAKEYTKRSHKLLSNIIFWTAIAKTFVNDVVLGLCTKEQSRVKIKKIDECRDVISWYHFFINAKLRRAVSGRIEGDDVDPVQSDWNGSAKVALIAIVRSKGSLQAILELTGYEDDLFPLLSLISRIEDLARTNFPRCDEFIRPGFDEEKAQLN